MDLPNSGPVRASITGLLLLISGAVCAHSQDLFAARQLSAAAGNPSGLHFQLRTVPSNGAFHIGEHIPVVLEFWSDTPEQYRLNTTSRDRSGRVSTEEFVVERQVVDPYSDFFGSGVMGWLGGGGRGSTVLDGKPASIELSLNDWIRFDHPGTYRLFLRSHRISRLAAPEAAATNSEVIPAVSNIIEVKILPADPDWAAARLKEIEELYKSKSMEESMGIWRDLTFLGTNAAVDLAFAKARAWQFGPGALLLVSARDRKHVVARLDKHLTAPALPAREADIRMRAFLRYLDKEAPEPLPIYHWQMPPDPELLKADAIARSTRFQEYLLAEAVRLIPMVHLKVEADGVRKQSAEAIAAIAPQAAAAARIVLPPDLGLTREDLIDRFHTFTEEQQEKLLGEHWDLIRSPQMIPQLRRVIAASEPAALPESPLGLKVWGASSGIAEDAARRLYQLSPEQAALAVRDDLASGGGRVAGFAAREMPSREVPEADGAFRSWIGKRQSGALPLIARFGSANLIAEMRAWYIERAGEETDLLNCEESEAFVTYFVRTLPAAESGPLLQQAMEGNRHRQGCHRFLLQRLANAVWNPVMEAQALRSLQDDPDPETVAAAAGVLAAYGSGSVEPFLWKRLERWNLRWRDRAAELNPRGSKSPQGNEAEEEARLGTILYSAIAGARSWIPDRSRLQRLAGLCLDADEDCRDRWSLQRAASPITIVAASGGSLYTTTFRLDSYAATDLESIQTRLRLYPSGTRFRWCPQTFLPSDSFTPGQREEMYQKLRVSAAATNLIIEPYSQAGCTPGPNGPMRH